MISWMYGSGQKEYIPLSEGNLEASMYSDYANTVRLVLKNSIDERTAYRNKAGNESINESINEALKSEEKMVLELISIIFGKCSWLFLLKKRALQRVPKIMLISS